jgi:hypothetical protein
MPWPDVHLEEWVVFDSWDSHPLPRSSILSLIMANSGHPNEPAARAGDAVVGCPDVFVFRPAEYAPIVPVPSAFALFDEAVAPLVPLRVKMTPARLPMSLMENKTRQTKTKGKYYLTLQLNRTQKLRPLLRMKVVPQRKRRARFPSIRSVGFHRLKLFKRLLPWDV